MGLVGKLLSWIAVIVTIVAGPSAFADHPNSGNVTLSSLIEEALINNLEIKEVQKKYEESLASRKQAFSVYFPTVGFEGGYQSSQIDSAPSSGTFGYARAAINLYRGGKDQAEWDVRIEEEKFQKLKLEKTKVQLEREVSKIFYELLYLQEGIAVKEEAIKANLAQTALAIKKKNSGYTSQADVLEFELREATLKSDINFLMLEEVTKERELRLLLARTDESIIRVDGHLHRESFNSDASGLLKLALQERIDLIEAKKNISVSNLEYQSAFGDYLPKVDLEGKYGKISNSNASNNNSVVMLKVSIPLFSGLETVYGRQGKFSEVAKSELTATRIRQEVNVQLDSAISRLRSIEERLNLEEKNIERSTKYYKITLNEYKRGVKNSPDVAGAADRLFDARLRNLEFRRDFYLTKLAIAEAVGISVQGLGK